MAVPEDRNPLTGAQRQTAAETPWHRTWLIDSGRTEAEIDLPDRPEAAS